MTRHQEVSEHQSVAEWCEARQMLNDAGMSGLTLPAAIAVLLDARQRVALKPPGVVDLAEARSRRTHQSGQRRRADLTVAPEVTE